MRTTVLILFLFHSSLSAQESFSFPEPTIDKIKGRWNYLLSTESPGFGPAKTLELADKLHSARSQVIDRAVQWVAFEERALRAAYRDGGVQGFKQVARSVLSIESESLYHELYEVDGGFANDAHPNSSTKWSLFCGDAVCRRVELGGESESNRANFYIEPRDPKYHNLSKDALFAYWREHLDIIAYIQSKGRSSGPAMFTVSKQTLLEQPPIGVSTSYLGSSMVGRIFRKRGLVYVDVNLFDDRGQVCYVWRSSWNDSQPLSLVSKSFWSTLPYVKIEREFTIAPQGILGKGYRMPDMIDMALTPYPRDTVYDGRYDAEFEPGEVEFDEGAYRKSFLATGGVEVLKPVLLEEGADDEEGGEGEPPLVCWPQAVSLHGANGFVRTSIFVANQRECDVSITSILPSCPCLQVASDYLKKAESGWRIQPFEVVQIPFTVDLGKLSSVELKVMCEVEGKDVLLSVPVKKDG